MSVLESVDSDTSESRGTRAWRPLVVGAATLAPMAVAAVATAAGVDLTVVMSDRPPMTIGQPLIFVAGLVFSVAGWAVLAVLERLTRRAHLVWLALAIGLLIVSMAPILQAEASGAARATLAVTHVAVAAVLVPGLRRTRRHKATGFEGRRGRG